MDAAESADDFLRLSHCPTCGYELSGLARDGNCPECGFAYDSTMFTLEGKRKQQFERTLRYVWIAMGLSFLSLQIAQLGFGVLIISFALISGVVFWKIRSSRREWILFTRSGVAVICHGRTNPHVVEWREFKRVRFFRVGPLWRDLPSGKNIWQIRLDRESAFLGFSRDPILFDVSATGVQASVIAAELHRRFDRGWRQN